MKVIKEKIRKINGGIPKELRTELNLQIGEEALFQLVELELEEEITKVIIIKKVGCKSEEKRF